MKTNLSHSMGRDQAKRKLCIAGSSGLSEDKREGLQELNEHIQKNVTICTKKKEKNLTSLNF